MLLTLTATFAMSQAIRTVAAILAAPLQAEFALSLQQLGSFAGAFHFAFGAMQLFMGIDIDLRGMRHTLLAAFPLAVAGALLSALAPGYGTLMLGQVLIGIGCAPAFLVCTVFIARLPPARFTALSGTIMSLGGIGLLATGTPRRRLAGFALLLAGLFVTMAASSSAAFDVGVALAIGPLSGYMILQYSGVRSAYAAAVVGRALGLFTMAMFMGVALMQWFTGLVASLAQARGADLYTEVLLTIAALLAAGAPAFAWLPKAPPPG